MIYELDVIEKDGIRYFQHAHLGVGRRFEVVTAFGEFEGGSLKVLRDNEVFAETNSIHSVGTHGPVTIFSGIEKIFNGKAIPNYLDCLTASSLVQGDKVIIDAPNAPQDGFFARYLKRQHEVELEI